MGKCDYCPDVYSGVCTGECKPYVDSYTLGLRAKDIKKWPKKKEPKWRKKLRTNRRFKEC